jgi:uncharacterized BrkB/YihY/UPF0761 family membrane protein
VLVRPWLSTQLAFPQWAFVLLFHLIPWLVLFLVYAANFAHFNVLSGALGGIVVLLLWIYLSGCVGVFGVCVCAAQAEVGEKVNDPQENIRA